MNNIKYILVTFIGIYSPLIFGGNAVANKTVITYPVNGIVSNTSILSSSAYFVITAYDDTNSLAGNSGINIYI